MNRILLLIARVARTWTLPFSMGIGAVAYLVFYYVPALEGGFAVVCSLVQQYIAAIYVSHSVCYLCKVDLRN